MEVLQCCREMGEEGGKEAGRKMLFSNVSHFRCSQLSDCLLQGFVRSSDMQGELRKAVLELCVSRSSVY